MDSSTSCYKFATLAVHAGSDPDQWICKSMWPPIITATTYKQDEPDKFVSKNYIDISKNQVYIHSCNL